MPNWGGGNTRAVEARARKAAASEESRLQKEQAAEDAKWRDDDRIQANKTNRKVEQQQKAEERLARKAEARRLQEEEDKEIVKTASKKNAAPKKLTQAEIRLLALQTKLKEQQQQQQQATSTSKNVDVDLPMENPNLIWKQQQQEAAEKGHTLVAASGINEAVAALAASEPVDRHPERRMKAAYAAYEEDWIPRMRKENPSLKRTQLKHKVWKQWQTAPENPMVQARLAQRDAQAAAAVLEEDEADRQTDY